MEQIELMPDGMLLTNPDGQICAVNEVAVSMFGWSRDQLLAASLELLLPAECHAHHGRW